MNDCFESSKQSIQLIDWTWLDWNTVKLQFNESLVHSSFIFPFYEALVCVFLNTDAYNK